MPFRLVREAVSVFYGPLNSRLLRILGRIKPHPVWRSLSACKEGTMRRRGVVARRSTWMISFFVFLWRGEEGPRVLMKKYPIDAVVVWCRSELPDVCTCIPIRQHAIKG